MDRFNAFFKSVTSFSSPYAWQRELAANEYCANRLIRIPTGFGKTQGVLSAWLWHRVDRKNESWPRRLVWCLPMRVLVEQTEEVARRSIQRLGLLWDELEDHTGKVGVHLLMGGVDPGKWHLYPEHCSVLIGTQDMLISRAMNRGYGSPRARWPMEFGLLNQDCLWIMDEVQLMDVGFATSAQMQAFREGDTLSGGKYRPCYTWWMSATLQRGWLQKSPETVRLATSIAENRIDAEGRLGHLWDDVKKPLRLETADKAKTIAELTVKTHHESGNGAFGPTLVVVNTVDRAVDIFEAVLKDRGLNRAVTDVRLVHSRFRAAERSSWRDDFLNRATSAPGTDRIVIATQVVEAGVDLSAGVLITELAPWPSLIQRFGRCARWGGKGHVIVLDLEHKNDKAAAPYSLEEIDTARNVLSHFDDVSPLSLEVFEEIHPEILPRLYPYEPKHLLLRHEIDELFDTSPDLSGADIDISRFIRSTEERDLQVFWVDIPAQSLPLAEIRPSREGLCAVPFLKARDWLCGKESASTRAPRLKKDMRAWVWDWLEGRWKPVERRDLYPGQTVLVDAHCGGYDPVKGWSQTATNTVPVVSPVVAESSEMADARQDDETLSTLIWQTIAFHGRETGNLARAISVKLVPDLAELFDLAGRWHDVGKSHPAFQGSIRLKDRRPNREDIAKAPSVAWQGVNLYKMESGERRPGFRHELSGTLALLSVLARHAPDHPALLGPWREFLSLAGFELEEYQIPELPPSAIEEEVIELDVHSFNLLAYLVCAHHGKVRSVWHSCPADQDSGDMRPRIHGICDGDQLPPIMLYTANQTISELSHSNMMLATAAAGLNPRTGQSWTERVLALLKVYAPFELAWLEAILRAADQRVSAGSASDPLLDKEVEL